MINLSWSSKLKKQNVPDAEDVLAEQWEMRPLYTFDTFKDVPADNSSAIDASFIIPLYNSEKFLDKCVGSLLEQHTQYTYEIILINDGSSDATAQRIEAYEQLYPGRVRAVHQKNQGPAAARNSGISLAHGHYIGFVDSDDWVEKNYVEVLLSKAYETNADIVKSAYAVYANEELKKVEQAWDEIKEGDLEERILSYRGYVWGGIFRKSLWKDIRFPVGYWYEDMIIRVILFRKCSCYVNIKEVLYYKVEHATSTSTLIWNRANNKSIEQYYLLKQLVKEYKKLGLPQDVTFYRCILDEASYLLWSRTRGLGSRTRRAVFEAAARLLGHFKREEYNEHLSEFERRYDHAFRNYDYRAWYLISVYKRFKRDLRSVTQI